jgi:hypothetical protein
VAHCHSLSGPSVKAGWLSSCAAAVTLRTDAFSMILTNEAFYTVLESDRRRTTQSVYEHALPRLHIHQMPKEYNWCNGVLLQDLGGLSAHLRQVLVVESRFPRFSRSLTAPYQHLAPNLPPASPSRTTCPSHLLLRATLPPCASRRSSPDARPSGLDVLARKDTSIVRRQAVCHAGYSAARIQVAVAPILRTSIVIFLKTKTPV